MDVAIRERRPVMQDKQGTVFRPLLNLLIEPVLLPFRQNLRFPRSEIGLHREIGFWQIESLFVVHFEEHGSYHFLRWTQREGREGER